MNEKLYELITKLPKENVVNLMASALDEMQAYNGRTRQTCILLALGAIETDTGWKLPEWKNILLNTASYM